MKTKKILIGVLLLFAIATATMPAYGNSDVNVLDAETVSLGTKDADIRDVLLNLARDNGINLIMDDSVQGRLTISLNDVSPMEAIGLILHTNGYVIEKVGDSIVAATQEELEKILPPISKIIALQYASASDLKQSLSEIASDQAGVQSDARTNSLIVTGTVSGVQMVEQAIELLDVEIPPEPQRPVTIKVFQLEHAQVSVIQALVSEFCSDIGKIQVDDRSNSLIIADEIAVIERLAEAIKQLDVPSPSDVESVEGVEAAAELYTRVFKLNNVDANALIDILQDMLSPDGKIQPFVRQKESITPIQPEQAGISTNDNRRVSQSVKEPTKQKWSDVLIVTDTADTIEKVSDLISKLDTSVPQVMIEAKMVELNLNDVTNIGIDWQTQHSPSKSTLGVGLPISETGGLTLQVGTLSTQHFKDMMLRIQALETNGQAKLVSNPSIITLDNELAQMIVADRIPIPTTYETEFSSTTSYEFINVGIMLTVVPHITEDGYILMDAMPEVNSIKEWTSGENPQPIISSRMSHTRVRVKDGQTFVIGGLLKDEQRETESRVPILCAIPFLGRLFRSKSTDSVKTDLVVFITPKICEDDS